jgi:hypothetical protein
LSRTSILFSPVGVERVLADLPTVAALLPKPEVEGAVSEAFPALRKTDREVYRWLANTHYEGLAEALVRLERVYAAGCTFDGLLATRSRSQFDGHLGELLVADDLLRRGYKVTTVPRSARAGPDLHVEGDGIDLAVEVYSPREFVAVEDWVAEVKDLLNQIDVAASYHSHVETMIERGTWPGPDPWRFAEMLRRTHDDVLTAITKDVEEHLRALRPLDGEYRHEGTPILTTVKVEDVHAAPACGAIREGGIGYPGFGGYSPAGVFTTIFGRAKKKASRRQVFGIQASGRAMVVQLDRRIAEDMLVPTHITEATSALEGFSPLRYGLDAIAFSARIPPEGLTALLMVVDDDGALTLPQAQALFGHRP